MKAHLAGIAAAVALMAAAQLMLPLLRWIAS
jgi:hypothetical protein